MPADAERIIRRRDQLKAPRGTWESHWQEIADRVLPRYAEFNTLRTPGAKRTEKIFDSTAVLALDRFAAILESVLTPRSARWHHLRATIKELNDLPEVKAWFDRVEDVLFGARYSPRSSFAQQQFEVYLQLGAFGTGVLFVGEDLNTGGPMYRSVHLGNALIAENHLGRVDTMYRSIKFTARQAKQKWPKGLPEAIEKARGKTPDQEFDFIHAVEPRKDRDPRKIDNKNMSFQSVWVAEEGRKVIEESGFNKFPYLASRFATAPGEIYGRSPAMTILPDIKMLNEMSETTIRQGQLATEPPLLLHDDGILGRPQGFGLTPGFLNYGGVNAQGKALIQPLNSGSNFSVAFEMEQQKRQTVNDAFFLTLFQILVDTPTMTATEALIRAQEKGQLLTPVMGRQQSEALGPMIEVEISILQQNGLIPALPDVLIEAAGEYEIEYDSPLSLAQKAGDGVAIQRTFEALAPLAAIDGTILDVFNLDEVAKLTADVNGAPQIVLNTPDEIQAIRDNRAAAEQGQAVLASASAVRDTAAAVKDLSDANAPV